MKSTTPLGTFRSTHRQRAAFMPCFWGPYLCWSAGCRWVQSSRAGTPHSCGRRSCHCSGRFGWRSGWAIAHGHPAHRGCTGGHGAASPPSPARTGPCPWTRHTGQCLAQTRGNSLGSTCRSSGTPRLHTVGGTELQLGPTWWTVAGKGGAAWGSTWQRVKQSRLVPRAGRPPAELVSTSVLGHPATSVERDRKRERRQNKNKWYKSPFHTRKFLLTLYFSTLPEKVKNSDHIHKCSHCLHKR